MTHRALLVAPLVAALAGCSVEPPVVETVALGTPASSEVVFQAVDAFRSWHARRLLYEGSAEAAGRICGRALAQSRELNLRLVDHFLNLSACQQNLGLNEAMEQSLENAGLAVCCLDSTLEKAFGAASLYAHFAFLGDLEEARSWRFLLERLPCPRRTKENFIRRAEILIARCEARDRLLTF